MTTEGVVEVGSGVTADSSAALRNDNKTTGNNKGNDNSNSHNKGNGEYGGLSAALFTMRP
ncbi:hypothetical protein [Tunturiibacter gelidoferens]|uniref:Uncharacterized protein n=1 Tax=Tunturiibacter lichenicola TaxID=2051959 RepID=A0A7Y9NPD8_9BACT|nr:hypothetical protein [Edaphobacter lichenicola]NYF53088.1 hypothetical protein [Edaphobacter lichenicola]